MRHIDELKALIAKWEAEEKGKVPYIEPCPICGGEMEETDDGEVTHVGQFCCHYWGGYIKSHNIIARVLRTAIEFTNGFCPEIFSAVLDLEALRAKAREGME